LLCYTENFLSYFSFLLLFFDFWLFVVWVFAQYDKVLHNLSLAEVFLRGELSSLLLADQDWGVMSLETSDLLGLAGGADGVNCVSNSDLCLDWLEAFIESNQHARVDRKGQVIQEVVVFSDDEGLHISAAVQGGQKTSEGHI
jgi:hypothetical protein